MSHFRFCCVLLAACVLPACSQPSGQQPAPATTQTANAVPDYAAMARGTVDVEGGLLNLASPRDGVVTLVAVKPGDHVSQGTPLARLNTQAASLNVDMAEAELTHAKAELAALTVRLPGTRQAMQRWQEAARLGAAEQQQADTATEANSQLQADIGVAEAGVGLAEQKLKQARHELDQQTLTAPGDAEVIKVLVQAGSTVSAQDHAPAFVLLPDHPLIVRAEVNESYVGRIKPGQAAQVTLESNPDQPALPASVLRVSPVLEAGHLSEEPQMARAFECILALKQPQAAVTQALRIGQTVLVKFND